MVDIQLLQWWKYLGAHQSPLVHQMWTSKCFLADIKIWITSMLRKWGKQAGSELSHAQFEPEVIDEVGKN